jgi:hypothetical protein
MLIFIMSSKALLPKMEVLIGKDFQLNGAVQVILGTRPKMQKFSNNGLIQA